MSNEDKKEVFKATISGGGSVGYRFPVPKKYEKDFLSSENEQYALEYYLVARHSYFHKMHNVYLMNTFWCVEHLMLSVLVFNIESKEQLKKLGGYHDLTGYWKELKNYLNVNNNKIFTQFDNVISTVQGYWSNRYPTANEKMEMTTTNKPAKTYMGGSPVQEKPGKVTYINLDKLDHLFNFFAYDVLGNNSDVSGNLMEQLLAMNSTDIYKRENKYSIIYPNRMYSGEQERKA